MEGAEREGKNVTWEVWEGREKYKGLRLRCEGDGCGVSDCGAEEKGVKLRG